MLWDNLKKALPSACNWSILSVKDCIAVYSQEKKGDLALFDLKEMVVKEEIAIPFDFSENGRVNSYLDKGQKKLLVEVKDFDITESNIISNRRDSYYLIDLK